MDRRLLRAAAKFASANELSEAVLGKLTPAQAQVRVDELLDSKGIYDEIKQRKLLLIQMAEHLDWIKENRDNPKTWANISRMFKVVSDQIERTNINIEDVSTKLAEDHARMFVEAITLGFDKILKVMADEQGEILEAEVIQELSEVGVNAAAEYIEKVTVSDGE